MGRKIFINGIDTGYTTPHTFTEKVVGSYNVYVTLTGYVTPEHNANSVTKDTKTTFAFPLTQETGRITVTSTPIGAKIFINGTDTVVYHPAYVHRKGSWTL